ncbi:MAG: glycosyltransferase [Chthoniobacterales bacterium]
MSDQPKCAVVIPFFNEEENVGPVCTELRAVIEGEIPGAIALFIDDGSSDETGARLDALARDWPGCQVFHLAENEGQSAALLYAFERSDAPIFATMDGDGQNDPRDLPKLLTRLCDADMVIGVRVNRQDNWARRKISRVANHYRSQWLGDGVSDAGCAIKVFRREVVAAFIPIRTLYSFMPALAVAAGFRVVEQPVRHRRRERGVSKYTAWSFLIMPIVDFIGLRWFRSRRCRPLENALSELSGPSQMESRAMRPWLRWAGAGLLILFAFVFLASHPHRVLEGASARKINLSQAERIALHRVRSGQLVEEELRIDNGGRLVFAIDVQTDQPRAIEEVTIDAINGRVLETRRESAEEEALELAAANHQIHPAQPLPR